MPDCFIAFWLVLILAQPLRMRSVNHTISDAHVKAQRPGLRQY
jgi:hypothetical protein